MKELLEDIRRSESADTALPLFRRLAFEQLAPHQLPALSRVLQRVVPEPELRVAYLGNFTLDFLPTCVQVSAAANGLSCGARIGAFGQYFQEAANSEGPLATYDPDVVVLTLALSELEPRLTRSFASFEEVSIRLAEAGDIDRIHPLFTKTNQFNLTAKRYSPGEVQAFVESENHSLRVVSVSDTFGDMGIVGLYLTEDCGTARRIDSFVLSCRALGRGVESSMLETINTDAINDSIEELLAEFVSTGKNTPAAGFYEENGFVEYDSDGDGTSRFRLDAATCAVESCSWIKVAT